LPAQAEVGDLDDPAFRPVGTVRVENGPWWKGNRELVGALEAYLCTDCGYFESYVKSVERMDFDKLEGFRWINPGSPDRTPFR